MKRNKEYTVNVKVTVDTNVTINAPSYEEALVKARELGVKDVVEFDTDFNDGSIAVTGIWNFDEPAK